MVRYKDLGYERFRSDRILRENRHILLEYEIKLLGEYFRIGNNCGSVTSGGKEEKQYSFKDSSHLKTYPRLSFS